MELLFFGLVAGALYLYHESSTAGAGGSGGGININIGTGSKQEEQKKPESKPGFSGSSSGGGSPFSAGGNFASGNPAMGGSTSPFTWGDFSNQPVQSNPFDALFSEAGQATADTVAPGGFGAASQAAAMGAAEGFADAWYDPMNYFSPADVYGETPTSTLDDWSPEL